MKNVSGTLFHRFRPVRADRWDTVYHIKQGICNFKYFKFLPTSQLQAMDLPFSPTMPGP
jgi:hypothetical protein